MIRVMTQKALAILRLGFHLSFVPQTEVCAT